MGGVAEKNLYGDAGNGAAALVGDVPVNVSDFAAGQIGRLAHGEIADGKAGGVGIGGSGGGHHRGAGFSAAGKDHQDNQHHQNHAGRDGDRQPVPFAGFNGRKQLWTGAHERNSTPVRRVRFKGCDCSATRLTDAWWEYRDLRARGNTKCGYLWASLDSKVRLNGEGCGKSAPQKPS